MRPSKNNTAANSVSKSQVQINKRRVRVNAQVTAVISLIEITFNIICAVIILITVRHTLLITLLNMTLYMVIIPYTFLMNTSENKKISC